MTGPISCAYPEASIIRQFSIPLENEGNARRTFISFPSNPSLPSLTSLPINRTLLNLKGKEYSPGFNFSSIKNTIFGNEIEGSTYMICSKSSKSSLQIQTYLELNPLLCFAIGVSIYLGKKPV